jgi:hypothetical protein
MNKEDRAWYKDILIVMAIFSLGALLGAKLDLDNRDNKINEILKLKDIEYCIKDTLDIDCVNNYLEKHQIKFSRIALAQIKLESNHLKHDRVVRDRNVTGMRVAAQRFTFAANSHDYGAFAKYTSLEDCILDYKAFQIQNAFFITTEEQYLEMLGKVYCKDPGYVEQVKKLIQ